MSFELKGKMIEKYDTVSVNDSFRKREFVIEVENERDARFNDMIKFQLTQDRCNLLDPVQVGDEVQVWFNIRGRKWEKEGRVNYFTNLEAWRMEKSEGGTQENMPPLPGANDMPEAINEQEDDLPF